MYSKPRFTRSDAEEVFTYKDELRSQTAEEIYEDGLEWISENDRIFFDACCDELRERIRRNDSKSAGRWLADLKAEAPPQWTGKRTPVAKRSPPAVPATKSLPDVIGNTTLYTNHGIAQIRTQLIAKAETSLCLSTWHFGSNDEDNLVHQINEACRKTSLTEVLLVINWQPRNPNRQHRVRKLLRGLHRKVSIRRVEKNHSKLVIVDKQQVLLGSANLSPVVSDEVAMGFSDSAKAKELRKYLLSLKVSDDRSPF